MKKYTFIDYATQAYLWIVAALVLVFHNQSVPHWGGLLLAHLGGSLVLHLVIRYQGTHKRYRILDFIRHYYPIPLYILFYRETGALNQMFMTGYVDPLFIQCDEMVFGFQPSLKFMESLPYLPVSELFYASYFSYYIMIAGLGLALFLRNRGQFFHFVSLVSFVFYVCFLIYIFLPVIGPRIFYRDLTDYRLPPDVGPALVPGFPDSIQTGIFFQIMAWIYRNFETPGAAFPSSHVAVALCTVYFSWRYLPRIRYLHCIVAALLCMATVYCRYHYVIDVAAGLFTAAILIPLGNWLFFRFEQSHPGAPNGDPLAQSVSHPAKPS